MSVFKRSRTTSTAPDAFTPTPKAAGPAPAEHPEDDVKAFCHLLRDTAGGYKRSTLKNFLKSTGRMFRRMSVSSPASAASATSPASEPNASPSEPSASPSCSYQDPNPTALNILAGQVDEEAAANFISQDQDCSELLGFKAETGSLKAICSSHVTILATVCFHNGMPIGMFLPSTTEDEPRVCECVLQISEDDRKLNATVKDGDSRRCTRFPFEKVTEVARFATLEHVNEFFRGKAPPMDHKGKFVAIVFKSDCESEKIDEKLGAVCYGLTWECDFVEKFISALADSAKQ